MKIRLRLPSVVPIDSPVLDATLMSTIGGAPVQLAIAEHHDALSGVMIRAFDTEVPDTLMEDRDAAEGIVRAWWNLALAWICLWHNTPGTQDVYHSPVIEVPGENGDVHPQLLRPFGFADTATTPPAESLQDALRFAGEDRRLTVPQSLLVRARTAYAEGSMWSVAIDAAAAVEVAAAEAIEVCLTESHHCPPAFVESVTHSNRGFERLIRACRDLGMDVQADRAALEELRKIRNQGAHGSEDIDANKAFEALLTARSIVGALTRLRPALT